MYKTPNIGPGAREIRLRIDGAWREVYVASRDEAIYVLHAFQKKTQRTAKRDIAAIESALNLKQREVAIIPILVDF